MRVAIADCEYMKQLTFFCLIIVIVLMMLIIEIMMVMVEKTGKLLAAF